MSDPLSPKSPRKGGKQVSLRVCFLDDTVHAFQVPVKALGHVLWEAVFNHLQLLESDYFDLEFTDAENLQCWIDREKPILKQLPMADTPLRFCVKFYTPDPGLLEDELTRYLFALQIKRDLLTGALPCSDNTAALLASYVVQAEIGDFLVDEYHDHTYLSSMKFVPQQTPDLLIKIMEYHKQHVGESPSEADLNLLDTARKVELYGIRMHPAKDHEGVLLNLAASHMGVLVFQNFTKINTFSWAKIRKLSFKRKKFLIKLHPENYHMHSEMVEHNSRALGIKGYYKDTVEFFFESRNECKGFWKKCIEHHAFFRCQTVKKLPRNKTRVVSRGSSFRYSGRTQKQLQEFVRDTVVKRPQFERSTSGRISSRSTSVTPKIHPKTSVHNSSDLHNSTASSGSHILEPLQDNHVDGGGMPTRLETAEVHSDSSMSGSRSLGSPKLDHSQVSHPSESRSRSTTQTPELPLSEPANAVSAATAIVAANADSSNQVLSMQQPYSPGGLKKNDRKLSAPVLGSMDVVAASVEEENRLSRCPEVENIPEVVQEDLESPTAAKRFSLTRSHSAAMSENMLVNARHPSVTTPPSPPPPPPPPPFDENDLPPPPPPPPTYCLVRDGVPSTISSTSIGISNLSTLSAAITEEGEEESRKKKRHPVGSAYYIAKELLMTERTYKKDLEVVCIWFRNSIRSDEEMLESMSELLFSVLDPIYEFHCQFVKEVDQRLSMWEGKSNAHLNGDYQRIGDILLNAVTNIQQMYETYLDRQEEILSDIDLRMKRDKKFEDCYKDFEGQKVCYLPLNTFILKPGHRLLHYKLILERLVKHYSDDHPDAADCRAALQKVSEVVKNNHDKMRRVENVQKLTEVQRDLVGIEGLVGPTREFIREGCLQKFSRKGYQQRMFFLFDDMLIYTSRTSSTLLLFKVHGQLPLKGMIVEEAEQTKVAVQNCFAIYAGNKYILCAASSPEEMSKWIEDINEAVIRLKSRPDDKFQYPSLKSSASSSENMDGIADGQEGERPSPPSPEKTIQHRANTTMHVCWHRNTSVSMRDHEKAVKNQLSGYLLRKFKNSNGWQKLWVVFTNFCLFFYKTYQDDFPLASLPLLGYAVSLPTEEDAIHKDHVFKLQFKNHVYFFRAESEYTFGRWMEVINCATSSARRTRLFSRMASEMTSPTT